jgi:hypothetical protein
MTSGVLDVLPKRWAPASVVYVPIAGFEFTRKVSVSKLPAPSAKGELIEVSDQNVIELLVGEMWFNTMPVLF